MSEFSKLDMVSKKNNSESIKILESIFPNVFFEGKIDFDKLKEELTGNIIDNNEKYEISWVGKNEGKRLACNPTTSTLRPLKEKSLNFDDTRNLYIEGDNLEVLKILQESYLNKIKCIYIDPPYNTGNDFIYNDNFASTTQDELLDSNQIDENNNKLISNPISSGKFHSRWLTMIYPRLKISRNLLSEDGLIFISIDINEVYNLKKICDEIFGEKNFITIMPRKTTEHIRVLADYELQNLNDYILVYCKNLNKVKINKKVVGEIKYEHEDSKGKYTLKAFQNSGENGTRRARPNLYYPIYYNENTKKLSLEKNESDIEILPRKVKSEDGRWLWSKEKFAKDNEFLEYKNGTLYRKVYYNPEEDQAKYESYKTWLDMYPNRLGAKALSDLGMSEYFDYSKPVELIKFILEMSVDEDSIVLDFFSGSATTAQAVIEFNKEKNYNVSYIMVQLDEIINPDSKAYKDGFRTICDVGEERIRRVLNNIDKDSNTDYGYRVYKLDSSNMRDVYYEPSKFKQSQLNMFESNIKEDRNSDDLLTQVILDWGLTLDLSIKESNILDNKVYFVEENSLVACFDNQINIDILNQICEIKPLKVVFRESSFKNDSDKINAYERIKKLSPETEISVI